MPHELDTAVARRRPGTRVAVAVAVLFFGLFVGLFAFTRGGSDSRDASAGSRHEPTLTITAGEAVRGTTVTVKVGGLVATRGRHVDVQVTTAGPVSAGGRDVVGYGGAGTADVDGTGAAVFDVRVPNALSGEDDVIPLVPGTPYLLELTAGDASEHVPFQVVAARPNTPYEVTARRGAQECGAPPLEVDFDGTLWVPDDLSAFPNETELFPGTFTMLTDHTGQLDASGTTTTFTTAATGYSC
jgi:hypothetical protein